VCHGVILENAGVSDIKENAHSAPKTQSFGRAFDSRLFPGEFYGKDASLTDFAFNPNASAMRSDYRLNQAEPQTAPGGGAALIQTVEPIENVSVFVGGDTYAGIGDSNQDMFRFRRGTDSHLPSFRGVFNRVVKQIGDDPL
jgi:hypothetical protein